MPCDDASVLHLDRNSQPALDMEKHPRTVRMMANRLEHQLPIDAVKIAPDVKIKHPVVPPATLTGRSDGIDRRAARMIPIGVLMENRFQDRLQITPDHFLGAAIRDSGHPQRAIAATSGLRDHHPLHRWRKIAP